MTRRCKRKRVESQSQEEEKEAIIPCGEVNAAPNSVSPSIQNVNARAIFVLENASLKKGRVGKKWKILDSNKDADAKFLQKQGKSLDNCRPNIVYRALRMIVDSPLNKAGLVGAVFVKIDKGPLFEIKPHVRIPRTCKRFCGIMLEMLEKKCIRANETREVLIRTIEEPVTRYLPPNSRIIGLSYSSEKLVDINDYVSTVSNDLNPVFVVGTMVNGKVNKDYTDDYISVSNYPLDASHCLGLICRAMEQKWRKSI